MSELKESQKMKVVQLHELTPKQFSNPILTQKNNPLGPQKDKNDHKIKSNLNVRIQGILENGNCSTS